MRYKFQKVDEFPDHVKSVCYAIKEHGHTMFPDDVVRRLNDLEKALLKAPQKTIHNKDYAAAQFDIIAGWAKDHGVLAYKPDIDNLIVRLNSQK